MRVVVDTNVFVSAALRNETTPASVGLAIERDHRLLKSPATEAELLQVLARPRIAALVAESSRDWIVALMARAELVEIMERVTASRDPKDDKFLDLAVSGRADVIVSGDADLLVLNPFRGLRS